MILLLGGYGAVGRFAAETLGRWYPGEVVVAGRDPSRAEPVPNTTARAVDVTDPSDVERVVAGADVVVMCVERANESVARACLGRGVHYVDVSGSEPVLASIARLDGLAVASGATAAISVGVAPGLTNVLARQCVDRLDGMRSLDVTVLLGLGEHHGRDAVRWTVDNLVRPVDAPRRRVRLPGFGSRTAFPFAFADQHVIARAYGVPTTTRLCFDSAAATWAVFALRGARVFAAARRLGLDSAVVAAMSGFHVGSDRFAVVVDGIDGRGRRVSLAASGRRQSRATGLVTAHVTRLLRAGNVPAGVHHLDRLADPATLFPELARDGIAFHERPS